VGGNLSDRFGRSVVMVGTLTVWGLVFFGFAMAGEVWVFMALNVLNGLCRAFFEPTAQALLADLTPQQQRMRVFGMRYFFINIGAALGPLAGGILLLVKAAVPFLITGTTYLVYAGVLAWFFLRHREENREAAEGTNVTLAGALQVVRKDLALGYFLLAGFLSSVGYSQIETNLPLILKQDLPEYALYSWLIALNAITVVVLQMFITRWSERRPVQFSLNAGTFFLGLGLMLFGVGGHPFWYILGMVVFTIGEILQFPSSNLFVDRLAPENLRGSYYGAGSLRWLGFFVGPMLGGWLTEQAGGRVMFGVIGIIVIAGIAFFQLGCRMAEKRFTLGEQARQTA
jgi:MFS family permease